MLFYKRKYYRVIDNSFQNCLSDGRNYYLAGRDGQQGQIVEIIQGPYRKIGRHNGYDIGEYPFIIGKCRNGLHHEIVFHPCGLVD
jgi:hypothetical protein